VCGDGKGSTFVKAFLYEFSSFIWVVRVWVWAMGWTWVVFAAWISLDRPLYFLRILSGLEFVTLNTESATLVWDNGIDKIPSSVIFTKRFLQKNDHQSVACGDGKGSSFVKAFFYEIARFLVLGFGFEQCNRTGLYSLLAFLWIGLCISCVTCLVLNPSV